VKVAEDKIGILLKLLGGHALVLKERKEYFAAVPVGNHPHRVGKLHT
jgi:hypothetical protein